jgi:hypothetical protein
MHFLSLIRPVSIDNYALSFSSLVAALGKSANMAAPLDDSNFLELVFLNSVCGLELHLLVLFDSSTRMTYFFMACLVLKAASFCVAGDIISSEGETYCWGLCPH